MHVTTQLISTNRSCSESTRTKTSTWLRSSPAPVFYWTREAFPHEVTVIHVGSCQTYGVPRGHAELGRLGRLVNRKRIARIAREYCIQGVTRRKRRSLTRADKKARFGSGPDRPRLLR
ncbi:IS3 family transposase [Streptomyces sp. NBC_01092]|uniref:IS3 family transposase n=1 Tax=Streptomyces sp. NBC_01092 TaxID=2903748 RepID=UPI0038650FE9